MSARVEFKKENLNFYLRELAKEYRKISKGNVCIELILVGGAAIVANYEFRDMTTDIDAIMDEAFGLKDAIYTVAQKNNLPYDWINSDFMKTVSYSNKLRQYSAYYKTFYNCIEVRTIKEEYLIAMKLKAARKYKNDLSDIIGILNEQSKKDKCLTYERVDMAVRELYGSWDGIDNDAKSMLIKALDNDRLEKMYSEIREGEKENKGIIVEMDKKYPQIFKTNTIDDIIKIAKEKKNKN